MINNKTLQYIFAVIVLLYGMHFFAFGIVGYDYKYLPGDLGDTRLINYFLEHGYQSLFLNNGSFWDAPFMFPAKNTLALSENLVGTMPLYALWRVVKFDCETSLQLWFISLFALNYLGCFYASIKLGNKIYSSALVAFIFAFAMPVIAQANHSQLMPRFIFPIAFYLLVLFLTDFKIKHFFLFMLAIVFQIYCGVYLGFLSFYSLLIFTIVTIVNKKLYASIIHFVKTEHYKIAIAIAINIVLIYPLLTHYLQSSNLVGMRSFDTIKDCVPRLNSYLFAYNGSYFWGFLTNVGTNLPVFWEHFLFPGGVVLFALLLIIIARFFNYEFFNNKNNLYYNIAFSCVIIIITTTLVNDFSFYNYIRQVVPGFSALKSVTRIVFPLLLLFALCIVPLFNYLETKRYNYVWITLLALVILLEQLVHQENFIRIDKQAVQNRQIAIQQKINLQSITPNSILAYTPTVIDNSEAVQADGMMVAQALGIKSINGYSSSAPPGFAPYWSIPDSINLKNWVIQNKLSYQNIIIVK